jgi:hypothetical protein
VSLSAIRVRMVDDELRRGLVQTATYTDVPVEVSGQAAVAIAPHGNGAWATIGPPEETVSVGSQSHSKDPSGQLTRGVNIWTVLIGIGPYVFPDDPKVSPLVF